MLLSSTFYHRHPTAPLPPTIIQAQIWVVPRLRNLLLSQWFSNLIPWRTCKYRLLGSTLRAVVWRGPTFAFLPSSQVMLMLPVQEWQYDKHCRGQPHSHLEASACSSTLMGTRRKALKEVSVVQSHLSYWQSQYSSPDPYNRWDLWHSSSSTTVILSMRLVSFRLRGPGPEFHNSVLLGTLLINLAIRSLLC